MVSGRSWRVLAVGAALLVVGAFAYGLRQRVSYSSADWTGRVLAVAQAGDRLDLVGIDASSAKSIRLARLDVPVSDHVVSDAAVVERVDGTALVAVTIGDGFAARLFAVDLARRSVATIGDVPAGRFPTMHDGRLLGIQVRDGSATQVEYALPQLRETARVPLPVVPLSGGTDCLTGTTASGSALLMRRDRGDQLSVSRAVPGGGSCTQTTLAMSLAATTPPGSDPKAPPRGHTLAVRQAGSPNVLEVDVGAEPLSVAASGDLAAVDVRGVGGHRAVAFVDLRLGRVTSTVDLPVLPQIESMTWSTGHLLVLGSQQAVVLVPGSTTTRHAPLLGTNLTYQPA